MHFFQASQAGVPVYMDVGGEDSPLAPAIFPHIFLLSPNETELARVSGLPTDTNDQIIVACKKLQKLGVRSDRNFYCNFYISFLFLFLIFFFPSYVFFLYNLGGNR